VQRNRLVLLPEGSAGWNIEYDDRGHEIERLTLAPTASLPIFNMVMPVSLPII
jgi:hypothetical protein